MKFSEAIQVTMEQANKMSTSELREVVSALAPVINNTRNALISNKLYPMSLQGFENQGFKANGFKRDTNQDPAKRSAGRMSINKLDPLGRSTGVPKNRNELLKEVSRGLRFYNAEDSSLGKQRKIMKEVGKIYNIRFNSLRTYSEFWNEVRRVDSLANKNAVGFESEEIIEETVIHNVKSTLDDEKIVDFLKEAYETKLKNMRLVRDSYSQGASGIFSGNK